MAGIRGTKPYMPKEGKNPTGMFSKGGSQKKDPIGGDFKPSMTAVKYDKPRKGPQKRDNRIKGNG